MKIQVCINTFYDNLNWGYDNKNEFDLNARETKMDNQVIEAKAPGLDIGDEVLLRMQAQEVHVIPLYKAVQQAQEIIRHYNRDKLRLTDVLSSLRKADVDNE